MFESQLEIRDMRIGEEEVLWRLFHETIHRVNAADYTAAQRAAWSPADRDMDSWRARLQAVAPFVAVLDGQVVGFSDVQADGLIDFMFVHADYQRRGIAAELMAEIERRARERGLARLYAHVSLTAEPFFSRHGFQVLARKSVEVDGTAMDNFLMERKLKLQE